MLKPCAHCGNSFSCDNGAKRYCSEPCRFESKVSPEANERGCRTWTAFTDSEGYGRLRSPLSSELAHRVAWRLTHGEIPEGLDVLHRCDNPPCVNINHLFLGTHQENMSDRDAKGRVSHHGAPRGSRNGAAKLSEELVREIRAACKAGETQRSVAQRLGCHQVTVSQVVLRKTWAGVA